MGSLAKQVEAWWGMTGSDCASKRRREVFGLLLRALKKKEDSDKNRIKELEEERDGLKTEMEAITEDFFTIREFFLTQGATLPDGKAGLLNELAERLSVAEKEPLRQEMKLLTARNARLEKRLEEAELEA